MHVSVAATLIIIIIILFVSAAHAARTLTVQEAEVSAAGSGQELRQLPRLDPAGGTFLCVCVCVGDQEMSKNAYACEETLTSLLRNIRPAASSESPRRQGPGLCDPRLENKTRSIKRTNREHQVVTDTY